MHRQQIAQRARCTKQQPARRNRAEETRTVAERMIDPVSKQRMLGIAEEYEKIAEDYEKLASQYRTIASLCGYRLTDGHERKHAGRPVGRKKRTGGHATARATCYEVYSTTDTTPSSIAWRANSRA